MAREGGIRRPVVAGQFYEGTAERLRRQIEECYTSRFGPGRLPEVRSDGPRRVVGLVAPHAGYMYSGGTAAHAFARLAADGVPAVAVLIGPNHAIPPYAPAAVQTSGSWLTPLGESPIDEEVATAVAEAWPDMAVGGEYFSAEHSLEVELPFLQHLYGPELRIVPVIMLEPSPPLEHPRRVGEALARALEGRNAVIVASTDLSHDLPREQAERTDAELIQLMLDWKTDALVRIGPSRRMCGYAAVAAMLHAARLLGATTVEKLAYSHSGMIVGHRVVGYAALAVLR